MSDKTQAVIANLKRVLADNLSVLKELEAISNIQDPSERFDALVAIIQRSIKQEGL